MLAMNEPKPFASLSSGLLARKGSARPAMRPQGFGQGGSSIEDLGWNDMGYAGEEQFEQPHVEHVPSPITALTPMTAGMDEEEDYEVPSVVEQQRGLEARFGEPMSDAEFEEALLSGAAEEPSVLSIKSKKPPQPLDELELSPYVAEPAPEPAAVEEPAPLVAEEPAPVVAEPAPVIIRAPAVQAKAGRAKAAFTLRLDPDRHLKLRLACALTGRSAQQIVTEALDRLLETKPEVVALAGQLPPHGGSPN